MFRFLLGMLVMAALGAYVSKPSTEDAEAELKTQLMTALANQSFSAEDLGGSAALLACRLDPNTCYDLVRAGLDVTYEDRILYAKLEIDGWNRRASCYGLYTIFYCPGGLQSQ